MFSVQLLRVLQGRPGGFFFFFFLSPGRAHVAPVTLELWHDHFSQPFAGDKESQVVVSSVGQHFTDSYKAGNCDGWGDSVLHNFVK